MSATSSSSSLSSAPESAPCRTALAPDSRQATSASSPTGSVVRNPFDSGPVARRYADARPHYHRHAVDLAARQLGISHARLAVDVACGTSLA